MSDLQDIFGGNAFNPDEHEPTSDFAVIPPGKYPVYIEQAEVRQTKAGNGHYIKITMSILEGDFRNRKLWDQINIDNPSEECQAIGLRTLSALAKATNIDSLTDSAQLVGKVVIASVRVKRSDNYGDQNEIRTYLPPDETTPPAGVVAKTPPSHPPQEAHAETAAPADGKPPWQR